MSLLTRPVGIAWVVLASLACGGSGDDTASTDGAGGATAGSAGASGSATAGKGGSSGVGGAGAGGAGGGKAGAGGAGTGGVSAGGSGGVSVGGSGGTTPGGAAGGAGKGGTSAGGMSAGGTSTGGTSAGGTSAGGVGGTSTGGTSAGGAGGTSAGGTSAGGNGGGAGKGGASGAAGTSGGNAGSAGSSGAGAGGASAGAAGTGGSGGCTGDGDCQDPSFPRCDIPKSTCVECLASTDPVPPGVCDKGVCKLAKPTCTAGAWVCTGPGYESTETSCDGYDNDCDGAIDEGCPPCVVSLASVKANLNSMWDIDFDNECNTYLTTVISGPDFTKVVPPSGPVITYTGNANQNMGYALVDRDPNNRRVVVLYSCQNASCLATNGITLLYTCSSGDPSCGCNGQANCPGFLNQPVLPATAKKGALTFNGFETGAPNALTVGPGSQYYVGNWMPHDCDPNPATCVACDPAHPGVFCGVKTGCCDTDPMGRLGRFTVPTTGNPPTFRVEHVFAGEQIYGLAGLRNGQVIVGTYAGPALGNLYIYDPSSGTATKIQSFGGAVFSITQEPQSGDYYLEVRAVPKIVRLAENGTPLALPATVPANPAAEGVLQVGPDKKLYRLQGKVDAGATLDVYDLP